MNTTRATTGSGTKGVARRLLRMLRGWPSRKVLAIFLSVVMVASLIPTASWAEAADELSAATATQETATTTPSDSSSSSATTTTQTDTSGSAATTATDAATTTPSDSSGSAATTVTDTTTETKSDSSSSAAPTTGAATVAAPGYPTDDASIRTVSSETRDPASNPTTVSAVQSGLNLVTAATWDDDTHANDNWSATDALTVSGIAAARQALVESGKEVTSSQVSLQVILSNDYVLDDAGLKSDFEADKTALAADGISASYVVDGVTYADDGVATHVSSDTAGAYTCVTFTLDFASAVSGTDSAAIRLPLVLAEAKRADAGSYVALAHDVDSTYEATEGNGTLVTGGTSAAFDSTTVYATSPVLEVTAPVATVAPQLSEQESVLPESAPEASALAAPLALLSSSSDDWAVSRFNLIRVTTGTATWDDGTVAATTNTGDPASASFNSNPGYDNTGTDSLVRSNDEVIYQTSYYFDTVPSGGTPYTGSSVVHVTATLPANVAGIASWDTAAMQWLENPVVSADGRTVEGDMTMTGDSTSNPLAPRVGTMNWVVNTGWAANGTQIATPSFTMTPTGKTTTTASLLNTYTNPNGTGVTVTAKGRYNAQIKSEGDNLYSITLQFYNPTGGLKGQELPDTTKPITVTVKSNWNQTFRDVKLNTTNVAGNAGIIPASDYGANAPWDNGAATLTTTFNTVYDGGTVAGSGVAGTLNSALVNNTTTLTITNYKIDMTNTTGFAAGSNLVYPDRNASKTSATQAADYSDATTYNFGAYLFKVATPSGYNPATAGMLGQVNITGLSAKTVSGQTVTDGLASDNTTSMSLYRPVNPPGNTATIDNAMYDTILPLFINDAGVSLGTVSSTDVQKVYPGQDIVLRNRVLTAQIAITNGYFSTTSMPRYYTVFQKIDSDIFDLDETNPYTPTSYVNTAPGTGLNIYQPIPVTYKYVARVGGWDSDAQLLDAHLGSASSTLPYFDSTNGATVTGLQVFDTPEAYRAAQATNPNLQLVGIVAEIEMQDAWISGPAGGTWFDIRYPAITVKDTAAFQGGSLITNNADSRLVGITTSDLGVRFVNETTGNSLDKAMLRRSTSTPSTTLTPIQWALPTNGGAQYISTYYRKAVFDGTDTMTATPYTNSYGDVSSPYRLTVGGYSWKVESWGPYVTKSIAQSSGGAEKTTFNIDQGDRRVDYVVRSGITGPSAGSATDTLTITDTIPAGMKPVDPSSTDPAVRWGISYANTGSTYTQGTTSYGGGSWSDDEASATSTDVVSGLLATHPNISYTLTQTTNADGSVTLTWVYRNYPVGYSAPDIHYSGILGDPTDSYNDLVNGTTLTNNVSASTTTIPNTATASKTVTVVRQEIASATKLTTDDVRDAGGTVGFDINFDNEVEKQSDDDVSIIDVFPTLAAGNLDSGYTDPGNFVLANVSFEGQKLAGADLSFYYATDASLAAVGKTSADLAAIQAQYTTPGSPYYNTSYTFPASDGWLKTTMTINSDGTIANAAAVESALEGVHVVAIGFLADTLNVGSKFKFHYEYDWTDAAVKDEMLNGGNFENGISFYVNSTKQSGGNKTSTAPAVELDKSLVSAPSSTGGTATYEVSATNHSNVAESNYSFLDTLTNASGITNIRATDQNGNDVTSRVSYDAGTSTFTISSIDGQVTIDPATGATQAGKVTITFDVTTDASQATFSNYVEPTEKDGTWTFDKARVSGDGSDTSTTDVLQRGGDVWYKVMIDNTSGTETVPAASCITTDTFESLTYVGYSTSGAGGAGTVTTAVAGGDTVATWAPGDVAAGAKASVWLHFTVDATGTLSSVTNKASADNRTDVVTDMQPDIAVAKDQVTPESDVVVGGAIEYTITATNAGSTTATNYVINDAATNLTYVGLSAKEIGRAHV